MIVNKISGPVREDTRRPDTSIADDTRPSAAPARRQLPSESHRSFVERQFERILESDQQSRVR